MTSVQKHIAKAIKKADKSYFFEDYSKQARAVINALNKEGYAIVPKETTEEMIEAGVNGIHSGKVRPHELVKWIYEAMIQAAKAK